MLSPPLALLTMVLTCPVMQRQVPEVAALLFWPSDGRVAKAFDRNLVFRDPATEAIVVAYPPEPGQASDPNVNVTVRREFFRFYLNNRVAPVVSSSVMRKPEGEYLYTYQVENCPEAKTPIRMWAIAGPPVEAADPEFRSSHPSWAAYPRPRVNAAKQTLLPGVPPGPFVTWEKWEEPLAPGSKLGGFQVTSGFRPGFTTAFVVGDGSLETPGEGVSEEMIKQYEPLQRPEVMRRTTLTIGPRFAPQTTNLEVAAAFQQDLQVLIEDEWLDGDSLFLQNLLAGLRSYIESRGASALTLQAVAQPGIETEIANALRLSLEPTSPGAQP